MPVFGKDHAPTKSLTTIGTDIPALSRSSRGPGASRGLFFVFVARMERSEIRDGRQGWIAEPRIAPRSIRATFAQFEITRERCCAYQLRALISASRIQAAFSSP